MSQLPTPVFADIVQLITAAKLRAVQAVNTSLIDLYWQIGEIKSLSTAETFALGAQSHDHQPDARRLRKKSRGCVQQNNRACSQ